MVNLVFAGSSSFVVPILEDIYKNEGSKLVDIAKKQAQALLLHNLPPEFAQIWIQLPSNFWNIPEIQDIVGLKTVISQADHTNHGKTISNPVVEFANKHGIETFTPEKLNNEAKKLKEKVIDLAIVASYGQIISSEILNIPKFGFVNWHPSKLPKYRGPTPIQTSLMNGEHITALSWIKMSSKMDAGNIFLQIENETNLDETFNSLALKMGQFGANTWALIACMQIYELTSGDKTPLAVEQNIAQVTTTKMINKNDKYIDFSQKTALEIYNHWRAYIDFPGTVFESNYFKQEVKILECDLSYFNDIIKQSGELPQALLSNSGIIELDNIFGEFYRAKNKTYLICKDQTLLPIKTIQLLKAGKRLNLEGFRF